MSPLTRHATDFPDSGPPEGIQSALEEGEGVLGEGGGGGGGVGVMLDWQ